MIITCLKIFLARIVDVSLGTIRTVLVVKGKNLTPAIVAFFEVLIWFVVAREALNTDLDSILIPIFYSLGYATGTLIGSCLSKYFIRGVVGVQIIVSEDEKELLNSLKMRGYRMNILHLESAYNAEDRIMLFLEVNSRSVKKLEKLVLQKSPNAFVVMSDTKKVYNGTLK